MTWLLLASPSDALQGLAEAAELQTTAALHGRDPETPDHPPTWEEARSEFIKENRFLSWVQPNSDVITTYFTTGWSLFYYRRRAAVRAQQQTQLARRALGVAPSDAPVAGVADLTNEAWEAPRGYEQDGVWARNREEAEAAIVNPVRFIQAKRLPPGFLFPDEDLS